MMNDAEYDAIIKRQLGKGRVYTGWKDKNGHEIYQFDHLKFDDDFYGEISIQVIYSVFLGGYGGSNEVADALIRGDNFHFGELITEEEAKDIEVNLNESI